MNRPHEALAAPAARSRALSAGRRPGRLRGAGLAAGLLALLLGMAGCAYHLGTPRLPGNAGSLGIGVIRNRTFAGELDVRLSHRLRELLLKHPGVELEPVEHSDLILDIELIQLQPIRARDIASTNFTSVSYLLSGLISVYDRRQGRYYYKHSTITVSSKLDFDTPTTETPAIRDEGIEDVLNIFALQVESLLFLYN